MKTYLYCVVTQPFHLPAFKEVLGLLAIILQTPHRHATTQLANNSWKLRIDNKMDSTPTKPVAPATAKSAPSKAASSTKATKPEPTANELLLTAIIKNS